MLIPLAAVKGILRRHFPDKRKGNFGFDMTKLVTKFLTGIDYLCAKDEYELDYATVGMPFGRLDMPMNDLMANFMAVLQEVDKYKPTAAPGPFITRVLVKSPPLREQFRIKHWEILDGYEDPDLAKDEDQDNEEEEGEEAQRAETKL
jgi:hypothetical protein